jgi:hypothetical protein
MRFEKTTLLAVLVALSTTLSAEVRKPEQFGIDPGQTPVMEISLGYTFLRTNAPPGQCGCFGLNGGFSSLVVNTPHGISMVADLSAAHAANVAGTAQSITVLNYLFGPRYSLRTVSRRFTPYVQVLAGGSQEMSNYTFAQTVKGVGISGGGGVSKTFNPRIGWNVVEADWVHSQIPNAQSDRQNYLRISSAITFRFGTR